MTTTGASHVFCVTWLTEGEQGEATALSRLSARISIMVYLPEVTTRTDQKTSDSTPRM